jgi:hypothetical protein
MVNRLSWRVPKGIRTASCPPRPRPRRNPLGRRDDGPEILASRSVFYPNTEHVMGWDISERGFGIVLSADVPKMVRDHLGDDVDAFLAEHDLSRGDISSWVCHPGGPKILEAMQEVLELPAEALELAPRNPTRPAGDDGRGLLSRRCPRSPRGRAALGELSGPPSRCMLPRRRV